MSQFWKGVTAGDLPPTVPLQFTTDDGTAIPAANNLNILGASDLTHDSDGIITVADPNGGNNLYVVLTNRVANVLTTGNAVPTLLVNVALPLDGVYTFNVEISALNTTDTLGASYNVFVGVIVSAGATVATKLSLEDKIVNTQAGMAACVVSAGTSGANFNITVTGLAAKTINWYSLSTFSYVGP